MRYIVTAEEMRALDATTINDIGLPGAVLMENAGRAVAEVIVDDLAVLEAGDSGVDVAVVCGAGNNGGDGYVIARCLREADIDATVYLATGIDRIGGDAGLHLAAYQHCGGALVSIASEDELDANRADIEAAEVVVDCVFGTGLGRDVEGHYRSVIEVMNQGRGRRVAVDIPSGLSADTGATLGISVQADTTVTMAFLKVGLAVAPGFASCGVVNIAEIGIPRHLAGEAGIKLAMLEDGDLLGLLPALAALDHKNRRGHTLVVAGSPGKRGAARLAGWAALRSGAGLVTIAAAGEEIFAADPLMTAELDADSSVARERLEELAAGKRCVAIGPGMASGSGGRDLVLHALAELETTLVIDADGLNHIGTDLELVGESAAPVILTPHPGEAARLLATTAAAIESDRVAAVRELARRSRAVVVLKGARTLVCDGSDDDAITTVNPTGNPGLASAGTGDVLTGMIAALAGQGLVAVDAARLGVYLHGRAADFARDELGERGVTAADVADKIPHAMTTLG
jgi:hydroxyethylthiazole kinase-like uncharacterized protein yjeF